MFPRDAEMLPPNLLEIPSFLTFKKDSSENPTPLEARETAHMDSSSVLRGTGFFGNAAQEM